MTRVLPEIRDVRVIMYVIAFVEEDAFLVRISKIARGDIDASSIVARGRARTPWGQRSGRKHAARGTFINRLNRGSVGTEPLLELIVAGARLRRSVRVGERRLLPSRRDRKSRRASVRPSVRRRPGKRSAARSLRI